MPDTIVLDDSVTMGGGAMHVNLDDVDDLFGDGVPLGLHNRQPSKRLLLRLDELRARGACKGLVWSRTGTIASIAPDGQSIELRYLRAHPKTTEWGLSEPTVCTPWQILLGGPIVHLSWAPTPSSELVVIDAVGRVMILNLPLNLNRPGMPPLRSWDQDVVDDLHAVVGTYWLHLIPQIPRAGNFLHATAARDGDHYNIEKTKLVFCNGPYHPNPLKSAFSCITTNGLVKMFWQQPTSNKYNETTMELESITSADELITHAALCSDNRSNKSILVALATTTKQLHLLQVAHHWGYDASKNVPIQNLQLNPTLVGKPLVVTTWLPDGTSGSHLDSSMTQLSHIKIFPMGLNDATKSYYIPTILTVRSYGPDPENPYIHELQSVVDRWDIVLEQSQTLHSAFEQLKKSGSNKTGQTGYRLKRLEPIVFSKLIVGVSQVRLGTVICFSFHDGTVEYRDRITMNEIWNTVNLETINSIHDAGFMQSGESSCLQTAVSPSTCSLVQMCDNGRVKWHSVRYTIGDPAALSDSQHQAIIGALTLSTAQVMNRPWSTFDDILALAWQFKKRNNFSLDWVSDMIRNLKIPVDYSDESHQDSLARPGLFQQLVLSTLHHLGWNGEYRPRNFHSKLAMLTLNLRNIFLAITLAYNKNSEMLQHKAAFDEPEVVEVLAGCVKWSMDLLCWLVNRLFGLLDDAKFMDFIAQGRSSEMAPYLVEKNDVSLHMVLCSSSRSLLIVICRRMAALQDLSQRVTNHFESQKSSSSRDGGTGAAGLGDKEPDTGASWTWRQILRCTSTPFIELHEFDKLLSALSVDIRNKYSESSAEFSKRFASKETKNTGSSGQGSAASTGNAANSGNNNSNKGDEAAKRAQVHCEQTMLLGGNPPMYFLPVIGKFFREHLAGFEREHSKPAELFFAEYDILELDDSTTKLAARRRRGAHIDFLKKVEISRKGTSGSSSQADRGTRAAAAVPVILTTSHNDPAIAGLAAFDEGPAGVVGDGDGNGVCEIPWRRCVRCASVMEDMNPSPNKPGIRYLLQRNEHCFCGGRTAILPEGELVG